LKLGLEARTSEADLIEQAVAWAAPHFGRTPFAVTTADEPEGVARIQSAFGALGAARKAESLLAGVAGRLYANGAKRIVVAGGETSGAVVTALGLTRARALPAGRLGGGFCVANGPHGPVSLYLKSGKLGAEDILLRALEEMSPDAG
jgi:uncharacterized protein YgbK (DUF1537 family)